MIRLNVGLNRKVGEPNYGSRGASINLDVELATGGTPGDFTKLSKGAKVRVTVKREGNRNVPTKVEIIE